MVRASGPQGDTVSLTTPAEVDGLPVDLAVQQHDLALRELFRLELCEPACAILARLLPPGCGAVRCGLARDRLCAVLGREERLGVDARRTR